MAKLSNKFLEKIQAKVPAILHDKDSGLVQVSELHETSNAHVDYYPLKTGDKHRKPVGDDNLVSFLMLNTNKDAYFSHGDVSVPIQEGTMVTFPGNVPHQTIINSGKVNLLGPFDVMKMQSVGGSSGDICAQLFEAGSEICFSCCCERRGLTTTTGVASGQGRKRKLGKKSKKEEESEEEPEEPEEPSPCDCAGLCS